MRLTLRRRVALWCAGLVVLSGVVVVTIVVVFAGRLLHERARSAADEVRASDPPAQVAGPAGAPGAPIDPGVPGPQGQPQGQGTIPAAAGPTAADEARRAAADSTIRDVRLLGLASVAGLAVVAVGASWVLAGHVVRPLAQVTDAARSISDDRRLDRRIAFDGPDDELGELAHAFDRMLDRLEGAFDAQRAFVANASHELRTPLAAMRAEVDVALDDPQADERSLRTALEAIRDEVGSTSGLVAAMLSLARADAVIDPRPVDLAEVAERSIELVDAAWRAEHDVRVSLQPAVVAGDPVLLQQLLGNLVGNAVRYDRPDGLLRVVVEADGGVARAVVENDGPAVDPRVVEALFSRFVRRAEQGEGHGLGLAICHAIVASHAGTIRAAARPEGGLRVVVELPIA